MEEEIRFSNNEIIRVEDWRDLNDVASLYSQDLSQCVIPAYLILASGINEDGALLNAVDSQILSYFEDVAVHIAVEVIDKHDVKLRDGKTGIYYITTTNDVVKDMQKALNVDDKYVDYITSESPILERHKELYSFMCYVDLYHAQIMSRYQYCSTQFLERMKDSFIYPEDVCTGYEMKNTEIIERFKEDCKKLLDTYNTLDLEETVDYLSPQNVNLMFLLIDKDGIDTLYDNFSSFSGIVQMYQSI